MNLQYKILWIEDDESFYESLESSRGDIVDKINLDGFEAEFQLISNPGEDFSVTEAAKYDLIIVDYNLTDTIHGSDLIAEIREHNLLTEIIFYSAKPGVTLRNIVAGHNLDGVFICNKTKESLENKILAIFSLTVRKVIDLENMRGIVMSGVADLDRLLQVFIKKCHDKLDDQEKLALRKSIFTKLLPQSKYIKKFAPNISKDHINSFDSLIKTIGTAEPVELDLFFENYAFDSHKKVDVAKNHCDAGQKAQIESIKNLLRWRNALAHQIPQVMDGVDHFKIKVGDPASNEAFNIAKAKELRCDIQKSKRFLEEISS